MKRYLTPAWIATAILTVIPFLYFLTHLGSVAFRDAAFANLFATILGVVVGVPIAFEVSRRQEEQRQARAKDQQSGADRLRARALFYRLRDEFADNGHALDRLRAAMDESQHSRTDHWDWILAIARGFAFDAYNDFAATPPKPPFPWELDDSIRLASGILLGVDRRAREAAAAHAFYLGYRADEASADKYLGYVRDLAREADRRVGEALSLFDRYARLYPHPEAKD